MKNWIIRIHFFKFEAIGDIKNESFSYLQSSIN